MAKTKFPNLQETVVYPKMGLDYNLGTALTGTQKYRFMSPSIIHRHRQSCCISLMRCSLCGLIYQLKQTILQEKAAFGASALVMFTLIDKHTFCVVI